MSYIKCLYCRECGREYPVAPEHVCEFCFGPLEVGYDYKAIKKVISKDKIQRGPLSIWRYEDLLPVTRDAGIDMGTGFTPLVKADNLGKILGLNNLYIKNDSTNPTFSFKDRVVSVATNKALEFGFDTLACASTGNLAGAVSAHGAKAKMDTKVFFPSDLEQAKILGAAVYGATLVSVDGTYDEVNRLCSELADNHQWAFVNVNMRPYYSEGSKTLGYEVAEQLGWRAPDRCIVPAASGSLFTKIWKGLNELKDLDLLESVNTIMDLAQPEGCSPIVEAFDQDTYHVKPVKPDTIAKSLAIGNPADGFYALKTIAETKGNAVRVPEPEVAECMKLLAETEGIFTETAGGVVISALRSLAKRGIISTDEVVVAFVTGNGLKTPGVIEDAADPVFTDPDYKSFQDALDVWNKRK